MHWDDCIHLPPATIETEFAFLPEEPSSVDGYIKHVYCNFSRHHVLRYSTLGIKCSHPKCIMNYEYEQKLKKQWFYPFLNSLN